MENVVRQLHEITLVSNLLDGVLVVLIGALAIFTVSKVNKQKLSGGYWLFYLLIFLMAYVQYYYYNNKPGTFDSITFFKESFIASDIINHTEISLTDFLLWFNVRELGPKQLEFAEATHSLLDFGALQIVKVHVLLNYLSEYPITHVFTFAFLSFLGFYLIIHSLKISSRFSLILCLLPVHLFWLVGMQKESLLILGIGLLISGIAHVSNKSFFGIAQILLGLILSILIRPYLMPFIIGGIIVYLIFKRFTLKVVDVLGIGVLSYLGLVLISKNDILLNKYFEFKSNELGTFGAELLDVQDSIDRAFLFLLGALKGIVNPLNWNSILGWVATLENLLVLFLIFVFSYGSRKTELIKPLLIFVFMLLVFFGNVVPNEMTLLRYKAPFSIVLLLVLNSYWNKRVELKHS